MGLHEQFRAPVERHRLGISDLLFCLLGVALHDWVLALSEQLGVFCRITRAFLDGGGRWFTWVWRRRRDSNPRYALRAYNGLANRRLQPLGHISAGGNYL